MNYKNICLSVLAIISLFVYQFLSSDDDHKGKAISVADKKAHFHKMILPAIDEIFHERMLIYKKIKFPNFEIEMLECVWEQFPHIQKSRYPEK